MTRISTIRGKFLLRFPSSTWRESDKGKLNSLSLSHSPSLSRPLSLSLSSMAGSFLSPPPLNNSSSNQSFSLCFGPQCLRWNGPLPKLLCLIWGLENMICCWDYNTHTQAHTHIHTRMRMHTRQNASSNVVLVPHIHCWELCTLVRIK